MRNVGEIDEERRERKRENDREKRAAMSYVSLVSRRYVKKGKKGGKKY